jgi:DNA polymerase-3 subunit delta'
LSNDKILNKCSENLYRLAREEKLPHTVIIECSDSAQASKAALETAEHLFCTDSEIKPCKKCGNCLKIRANSHPDVKTVCLQGNSKSIKIEDIRFIREDAYISSYGGGYKFYIIADADYLTVQAQNAFIKILEEPPQKVIFFILCKSSLSLLGTVRSRSQIFKISCEPKEDDLIQGNLAENIMQASLKGEEHEVIRLIASIPSDRMFLKNLIDDIIENYLALYVDDSSICGRVSGNRVKLIDELKYAASLVDKNINFNLLTCYLCACL